MAHPVKQGDEKIKLQSGEFNLTVTASLETDYDNKWEAKPFFRFMKGFYEKYIYADSFGRLKGQLWDEGWGFINEVKAFMNLYKYR